MKIKWTKTCLLLVLLCICSADLMSQDNYFKILAQYRVRSELRDGYRTLQTDSSDLAFFIGQRARLILDYSSGNIQFYSSIQDSRTWGDEEQKRDIGGLQVNELWSEIKLKNNFSIKMGRQELVYDDHRLLGNLDWANLTISHDALLLKYSNNANKIKWHIGAAYNQSGEPIFGTNYTLKNYKLLGFSYVKKEFKKGHTMSGLAIINGLNSTVESADNLKATYTIGPLYNYNNNGWKAVVGAYYQGGKTENNLAQNAYMLNVYGEHKIKKIILGLGMDYLSGNKDDTNLTADNHSFNTLYATNHKFYGYMDYFLAIPTDTKQRGLMDGHGRIGAAFNNKLSSSLDIHYFLLANEYKLANATIDKPLGLEADLIIDFKPSPILHLQGGLSILAAKDNMEYLKGGNSDNLNTWAYVMVKISPTMLMHEIIK